MPTNLASRFGVASSRLATMQSARQLNQQPQQQHRRLRHGLGEGSNVWELREYKIKPQHFPAFLKLSNEHMHRRTAHSPLLGYFVDEIGGVNSVTHLWPYESFEHRASVRKALGEDEEWNRLYMDPMRPMLDQQDNACFWAFHWLEPHVPPSVQEDDAPGIYEMRRHTLRPGSVQDWAKVWECGIEVRRNFPGALIGVWFSEIGQEHQVMHMWRYASMDERVEARKMAYDDPRYREVTKLTYPHMMNMTSKLMVPAPWSPAQ